MRNRSPGMTSQSLKVLMLSSSRSTSASVTPLDTSPLLVAKTAPEARKNSKRHVSFKTLAKLKSVDDVDRLRKLTKEWSGERGDGVDDAEAYDQGPSPLVQSRSLVLEEKKSVSFRLTDEQRRRLMTTRTMSSLTTAQTEIEPGTPKSRSFFRYFCGRRRKLRN